MHDTKNLIFAIVLSLIVLFCWQYFYAGPKIEQARKYAQEQQKKKLKEAQMMPGNEQASTASPDDASASIQTPAIYNELRSSDRQKVLEQVKRIKIQTGKLHGSISLKGARFDDLTLADHKIYNDKDADEVALLSPVGLLAPKNNEDDPDHEIVYFSEFGWLKGDTSVTVPDAKTIWYSEDTVLTPEKPVTLSWDNNHGLKFFIQIAIDKNFLFTVTKTIENYGSDSYLVFPYGRINRVKEKEQTFFISHEGAIGAINGKLSEFTYEDLKDDGKVKFDNSSGWLGIADKYWLTTVIPDQEQKFDINFSHFDSKGQDKYQVDYLGNRIEITPGQTINSKVNLFAGPKEVNKLDEYGEKLNIPLFDRAVDFGVLYFLTKPIYKLLMIFYGFVENFGIAIMMLTVLLKLCLFPLANKSYVSMHHLKRLQPQMLDIKERYKNDKVAMNKAMMDLYKEEKVNPMSGCLPILIQIPIFFALYKVLFVTIEMRHAPFYGWINDLSAPDPTTIFNLFGLLPFDPPQILMVGAWPIIMGITMFLQQKMSPAPTDPVQAKVMKMLPWIFVFLLSTFPAGLVIYWAWNNTLSILQQWVITRRLPK
ncbi:MAG: membrane protein insertase YidC [Rickettsiales bacterium]|nr:membrane protein insertase YidC [Pseudomonadota bacterium]MDA0965591.1 membrane protein insertase YidC [Pseudomonadota bacterium]MDG4542915.1 membrane protein insertase YidC [Rickettsiales bacterium]MDG4544637.1 membrane protein insertase YidC [Rickettsiales bacterium]MDG4546759.1 membrane protein insertase YidC [Rickettsiales bacterium]